MHKLITDAIATGDTTPDATPDAATQRALEQQIVFYHSAVQIGVNALAAPVFDHRGDWRGAIALVGASQFIPEHPAGDQIAHVTAAAAAASRRLGWGVA